MRWSPLVLFLAKLAKKILPRLLRARKDKKNQVRQSLHNRLFRKAGQT